MTAVFQGDNLLAATEGLRRYREPLHGHAASLRGRGSDLFQLTFFWLCILPRRPAC